MSDSQTSEVQEKDGIIAHVEKLFRDEVALKFQCKF